MCRERRGSSGACTRLIADLLSCFRLEGLLCGYPRLMAYLLKNMAFRARRERQTYSDSHGLIEMLDGSALEYVENGAFSKPTLSM